MLPETKKCGAIFFNIHLSIIKPYIYYNSDGDGDDDGHDGHDGHDGDDGDDGDVGNGNSNSNNNSGTGTLFRSI